MTRGKPYSPSVIREIIRMTLKGYSARRIERTLNVCRRSIDKMVYVMIKDGNYTEADLNKLSDEELFKLIYPCDFYEIQSDTENGYETIVRTGKKDVHLPDFYKLANQVIDERKSQKEIYFRYISECKLLNKPALGESAFFSRIKKLVDEYKRQENVYMVINHPYGQDCQLDYAGKKAELLFSDGSTKSMIVMGIIWPASGYLRLLFLHNATTQETCLGIGTIFRKFGVIPRRLVIDNAKSMVIKHCKGKEVIYNQSFEYFMHEMDIEPHALNPYSPQLKSQIEYAMHCYNTKILPVLNDGIPRNMEEWELRLDKLTDELINQVEYKNGPLSREDRFITHELDEARPLLMTIPEFYDIKTMKVNKNYHIKVDDHFYSVPYTSAGLWVTVKTTPQIISIESNGQEIARHQKVYRDQNGYTTLREHMHERHRAYLESSEKTYDDEQLLKSASSISTELTDFCKWRLSKNDSQRVKACLVAINFMHTAKDLGLANKAISMLMDEEPNNRHGYKLKDIYKKLISNTSVEDLEADADEGNLPYYLMDDPTFSDRQEGTSWQDDFDVSEDQDAYIATSSSWWGNEEQQDETY